MRSRAPLRRDASSTAGDLELQLETLKDGLGIPLHTHRVLYWRLDAVGESSITGLYAVRDGEEFFVSDDTEGTADFPGLAPDAFVLRGTLAEGDSALLMLDEATL